MRLFGRRPVNATVTALTWERVVMVEILRWHAQRSSSRPLDPGVRNVRQHTEPYWGPGAGSQPGMPDSAGIPGPAVGNTSVNLSLRGYYTYDQLEWEPSRSVSASGAGSGGVEWPEVTLGPGEQIRSRRETHTATFGGGGREYRAGLPEPQWRALEPGAACQLTLGLLGRVRTVSPGRG